MSNQWHRGGGGGGRGRGRGRGHHQQGSNQPRKDLLGDDFGSEFPLWQLTSYGPGASKNNLLGGDTSPEELRWAAGATKARTGDHRRVFETFREYEKLKENDRSVLKSMAEAQLKQVFDGVDAGTMKPAGVERKIEFHMVPPSNGGRAYERVMPTSNHSSGAFGSVGTFDAVPSPTPFGGIQQQQSAFGPSSGFGNVGPVATTTSPSFVGGGGGGGGGGFQHVPPSTPTFGGFGQMGTRQQQPGAFTSNVPVAKPVVTITPTAPQNQAASNQFTPEFNSADPFGSRDFVVGQIPDQPPPLQYCT